MRYVVLNSDGKVIESYDTKIHKSIPSNAVQLDEDDYVKLVQRGFSDSYSSTAGVIVNKEVPEPHDVFVEDREVRSCIKMIDRLADTVYNRSVSKNFRWVVKSNEAQEYRRAGYPDGDKSYRYIHNESKRRKVTMRAVCDRILDSIDRLITLDMYIDGKRMTLAKNVARKKTVRDKKLYMERVIDLVTRRIKRGYTKRVVA